jgi:chemotaxis signal transduction protein
MNEKNRKINKATEPQQPAIPRLTAFTAAKKEYGFQVQVAGCMMLRPAVNLPPFIIGTVELADQLVPIIDMKAKNGQGFTPLNDRCCIVLFEHRIGLTTIVTGRLYADACEVFELIVDYMDAKEHEEELLSISEDAVLIAEDAS